MDMSLSLKRAARFNPAWKPALICKIATDQAGEAVTDAGEAASDVGGTFLYELSEESFGRLAYDQEQRVWVDDTPWQGNATLVVISSNQPDPMGMIQLGDVFYQVLSVQSADALGVTIRYSASAIAGTVPTIRNGL